MPTAETLLVFAALSLGLALTPGPNMLYLVSRSLAQGTGAGMVSLAGCQTGSLAVMLWLAGAKRETGEALGSRALIADSHQTYACWYLSIVALAGIPALGQWPCSLPLSMKDRSYRW